MNALRLAIPCFVTALICCGCGAGTVSGLGSRSSSWSVEDDHAVPGIHRGHATVISLPIGSTDRVPVVVWCADAIGDTFKSSEFTVASERVGFHGAMHLPDDRTISFDGEGFKGLPAKVSVAGQDYDCTRGSLFLISAPATGTHIRQLNIDTRPLNSDVDLVDFALQHPEVSDFFIDAQNASSTAPTP